MSGRVGIAVSAVRLHYASFGDCISAPLLYQSIGRITKRSNRILGITVHNAGLSLLPSLFSPK